MSDPQELAWVRRKHLGELLHHPLRVVVERSGHDDVERDEQVARMTCGALDASPAHSHGLAALRARRNLDRDGRVERRHLHLRPERRLDERHRHLHREIGLPAPGEDRMRRHVHDHVQVAGWPTVGARGAAALHSDALTVVDPGRNAHLHGARPHFDAATLAIPALVLDDVAATTARGAHLRERERALIDRNRARSSTRSAYFGHRAGLGAGAVAHVALRLRRDVHRGRDAMHGVEKVEVQLGFDVVTALGPDRPAPTGAAPSTTAALPTEQATQDVAQAAEITLVEVEGREWLTTAETGTDAGRDHRAHLVVLLAPLRIAEHVVGGGDLLEPLLRGNISAVRVGVVLLGELAIGASDLRVGRLATDTEDVVIVLLEPLSLRWHATCSYSLFVRVTRTIAGRSTRPFSR